MHTDQSTNVDVRELPFTITDCQVDGGKHEGASLYTAIRGDQTILLEAPNGMYERGQTDSSILTDISHAKAHDGQADFWIGSKAIF